MIEIENDKKRPRAALIGGGFIGPVHAEALRRINIGVVGILGSSVERTEPMARALGIGRIYATIEELCADPEVDVVHVTSPNNSHFEQVKQALAAGKHVVCEKPLARDAGQSSELVRLAKAKPELAAAVNYNIRYYPLCHEMKSRIEAGEIGRVFNVTGSYTQDWLLYREDYNWRVEADGGSNLRAIADIGTHWMDLAQFIVGKPVQTLTADLATFHRERLRPVGPTLTFNGGRQLGERLEVPIATEDYGSVLFRMDDDIRGLFHVSQAMAGRKNHLSLEISGSQGSFVWNSEEPNELRIGRRNSPDLMLQRDPAMLGPTAASISNYPGGHAEGFPDTFKQLAKQVYTWIEANNPSAPRLFPTFEEGHREIMLCEAIAKSAIMRSWVDVDPA